MSIVISDSFTRANSNTVGAADVGGTWTEGGTSVNNEQISSNTLVLGANGSSAVVYIDIPSITLPISLTCKVNASVRSARIGYKCDTNIIGNHIALNFGGNTMTLAGNNGATTTSGAASLSGDHWIWLDATQNGSNVDLKAYLSSTSTKPGSPDFTLTNCVESTGTKTGIFFDSAGTGNLTADDFSLRDGSPFTFTIGTGSYAYTGVSVGLLSGRRIAIAVGSYIYTGIKTLFNRRRWVTQNKSSATWTNPDKS